MAQGHPNGAAPKRIVYVSCNPASQARDLAILCRDYTITAVQPVDMFPHTMHVENVCALERNLTIMILHVILLLVGLALIVFGADILVEGASSVARRFGLSEFIIGLTIVGMGTSAPEMVVSFIGAAHGNADIAIGNVVGSNIINTLLILGLTALILPMTVTPCNRKRDIPVNIFITALLVVLGLEQTFFGFGNDGLSRIDGAILNDCFRGVHVDEFQGNHPDEEESPPR